MKTRFTDTGEFAFQLVALLLSAIVVHGAYVGIIRPKARADLAKQAELRAENPDYISERSIPIMLRDVEQEACFILMFWAIAIMGMKSVHLGRDRSLLRENLLQIDEGMRVLPEDTRDLSRQLESLPSRARHSLLPPNTSRRVAPVQCGAKCAGRCRGEYQCV